MKHGIFFNTKRESIYKDPGYIATSISILKDQIDELEKISVYNDDRYLLELVTIRAGVEALH